MHKFNQFFFCAPSNNFSISRMPPTRGCISIYPIACAGISFCAPFPDLSILALNEPCKRGEPVKCDQVIRLMHLQTRCFLHSHDFPAPLTRGYNVRHNNKYCAINAPLIGVFPMLQEVSCFGKEGENSDTGDNYRLICGGDVWEQDQQVWR